VRKRDRSLLSNIVSLVLCGLLAGLVVAAAAFPAVAMSGLAAKGSADAFDKLPSDIIERPSPQMSYMYASDGVTLLTQLYDEYRMDVRLDQVAEVMQQAMVAAEDVRFYKHNGVDGKGVARAFVANQTKNKVSQGGSTLTMQYVRQAISYSAATPAEVVAATEQTPTRKLREMKYAIALEKKLNKEQILERYLNIAPFGHSSYGVYAAASVYFNKHPKDLTLGEAALLAGLPKAPSTLDPTTEKGRPLAMERRTYVLEQMVEMGKITEEQKAQAEQEKIEIYNQRAPRDCTETFRPELGAGFFCDFLVRWWLDQAAFGEHPYLREQALRSGGYKIITSLDVGTQAAAFREAQHQSGAVGKNLQVAMGSPLAMMLAAVEPGTGRVQAIATNRRFSNDQTQNGAHSDPEKRARGLKGNYPSTTVPFVTGSPENTGFQSGSNFKIFAAVAALEKGIPLDYTIDAQKRAKTKYADKLGAPSACPGTRFWCPSNAVDGMSGVHDMWSAFGRSVNTYFVPLTEQVGADRVIDAARRAGIKFRSPTEAENANDPKRAATQGAFTLGTYASVPLDLANAYATLAADGRLCEPTPVVEVRDRQDNKVPGAEPVCKDGSISPDVARAAMDAARCPVGDRSATSQCTGATAGTVRGIVGRPTAGKTGTTDDDRSATFVATTKRLSVAGFLTDPDYPKHGRKMEHPPVNNAVAYTLRDGMNGRPADNFAAPSEALIRGNQVRIPDGLRCGDVGAATGALRGAGFAPRVDNEPIESDCPAGSVASTVPSNKAPKGSSVTIKISAGGGAPPPADPGRPNPRGPGRAPAECFLCPSDLF